MLWMEYHYLFLVACGLVALAVYMARCIEQLTRPSAHLGRTEALTLLFVLLLGLFAIYGRFFLGIRIFAYQDVGSDTLEQYVPFYVNMLDSIREGTFSLWNFSFGLGVSPMNYPSWLLDPFNLLLVPLGLLLGDKWLGFLLVALQGLKVVLASFVFREVLARMCKTPLARIFGASLYGFCGFIMLWGQHYWLGGAFVTYTVLLLALELLMEKWTSLRFLMVALTVGVTVTWSPYIGYMSLFCAAVYAFLRCVQVSKKPLNLFGRLVVPVLCGLFMGCVTLVPYAQFLLSESTRTESAGLIERLGGFATGHIPLRWIPLILSRFLGNSLISSGEPIPEQVVMPTSEFPLVNCFEIVSLGYSVAVCVLVVQFLHWTFTEAPLKDRVVVSIAVVLIALYCVGYLFPSALNLFVEPKYRSSFALASPICAAMAIAWEQRVQKGRVALALGLVAVTATFGTIAWSLVNTVNGRACCLLLLACVVLLTVALVLSKKNVRPSAAVLVGLFLVVVVSQVGDGFFTVNNRQAVAPQDFPRAVEPGKDAPTMAALDSLDLDDQSFVRVEKTYADWTSFNDALIEGYAGMTTYNSTYDGDLGDFFKTLWPEAIIWDPTYLQYNNTNNRQVLDEVLGIRYVLAKDVDLEGAGYVLANEVDGVKVYENPQVTSILTAKAKVLSESELEAIQDQTERQLVLREAVVVPDEVATRIKQGGDQMEFAANVQKSGSSQLEGTIQASSDGVCCLAIPHTATWHVIVDGNEVPTFRANYGFYGFQLAAGTHTFKAYYTVAGGRTGLLAGMGGVCATILCVLALKRIHSSRKSDSE